MSEGKKVYILDSFAVLTLLENEKGAGRVQAVLERSRGGTAVVYLSMIIRGRG